MLSSRGFGLLLALACLLACAWPGSARMKEDDALKPAIREAADRATEFLLRNQQRNGMWFHQDGSNLENDIGATALVGMALHATDPQKCARNIKAAEGVVMANMAKLETTYAIALCIMFLERSKKPTGPLVGKLLTGQMQSGAWGYHCPPKSGTQWDNSNTHFAVLALLIARKGNSSPQVERALRGAEQHFRRTQDQGGWSYCGHGNMSSVVTTSMTCAGLLGLAVSLDSSRRNMEITMKGDAAGSAKTAKAQEDFLREVQKFNKDPQVQAARRMLIQQLPTLSKDGEHVTYILWSVERIAFIYGEKTFFDTIDWYELGSKLLMQMQIKDGSFPNDSRHGANVDTCFALLFLRRVNLLDLNMNVVISGGGSLRSNNPAVKAKRPTGPKGTPEEAKRLQDEMLDGKAIGPRVDEIMKKLEENTASEYREALLEIIYSEKVRPSFKAKAREALANRMTRLDPDKLIRYLEEKDPELKLAAIFGAERGEVREVIPNLITLLGDKDQSVSGAAYAVLKGMTKQDHGRGADGWKRWYEANKSGKKGG